MSEIISFRDILAAADAIDRVKLDFVTEVGLYQADRFRNYQYDEQVFTAGGVVFDAVEYGGVCRDHRLPDTFDVKTWRGVEAQWEPETLRIPFPTRASVAIDDPSIPESVLRSAALFASSELLEGWREAVGSKPPITAFVALQPAAIRPVLRDPRSRDTSWQSAR